MVVTMTELLNRRRRKMTNDFLDNMGNDLHQKMLREISNDDKTPKNRKRLVEGGFYEATDCSDPSHICTCGTEQTLTE